MEKKMLLQELSDYLATREGITKKKSDAFVRALFDTIQAGLAEDSFVKVKGFGTFKMVEVSDRESVDVNTGERIQINGHDRITFTPDNQLKEQINRPFAHFQTIILNEDTDLDELESVQTEEPATVAPTPDTPIEGETHIETTDAIEETATTPEQDSTQQEQILELLNTEPEEAATEHVDTIAENQTETAEQSIEEKPTEPDEVATEQVVVLAPETIEETQDVENDNTSEKEIVMHTEQNENNVSEVTYVVREKEHRLWKTTAIVLIVVILMVLSYLAGYFRWFCPCENPIATPQDSMVVAKKAMEQKAMPLVADTLTQDSIKTNSTTINAQETTELTPTTQTTLATDSTEMFRQLPGGRYKIVGTRGKRQIRRGETIRTIALEVYGSKGFAPYIIVHNQLDNPDNVEVGTELLLPKVTLKK